MKITFVMPGVGKKQNKPYVSSWKMEPLAFAVLRGITPPNIDIDFYDDRMDAIPYEIETDLVAINAETYTAKRAYHIANEFRKRNKKVILGGYHPTLVPNEATEYADSIVVGEVEQIWKDILNDVKNNSLKKQYKSQQRADLNNIFPNRNIYKNKKYLPVALIESARGCNFTCDFCSISSFYQNIFVTRPVLEVIEEIKSLNKKTIFFIDDNIAVNHERAKELFNALIPLKIKWIGQGCINIADDLELLKLMKKSGCIGLLIGFESLNKNILFKMKKSWAQKNSNYETKIKIIHDNGISIYATFIFGYEDDDIDSFNNTLQFAIDQKLFMAAFNHLVPFPGTSLYKKLENEGRLLYEKWWLQNDYHFGDVVFMPYKMSPSDLTKYCFESRKSFYKISSILKRFSNFKGNIHSLFMLIQYFYINIFSKVAVEARQGIPLGEGLD